MRHLHPRRGWARSPGRAGHRRLRPSAISLISASAANKPQLLEEDLALIGDFSESPAPRNPSFYRKMKEMSDTGFLQFLAVASPKR